MILINKDSSNVRSFTLNELVEGSDPFDFLFSFTNDTTNQTVTFHATDISVATERYNQFDIIETTVEDLYNAEVTLSPEGYWSYIVYQMPQESPPNLNPDDAVKILEIGKVLVKGEAPTNATFTTNDNTNNVVFDN